MQLSYPIVYQVFSCILPAMLTICVEHNNNYAALMTCKHNQYFQCLFYCSLAESIGSYNTSEQDLENKYAEIGKQLISMHARIRVNFLE